MIGRLLGELGLRDLRGRRLGDMERRRVTAALFPEGAEFRRFRNRFAALMTMSVLIAVMGLLGDSTAVVIGAMLVAPLMTPVLGVAGALVMGMPRKVATMGLVTLAGAAGAVGLAALVSFVLPGRPEPIPSEVLARTAPNLLDLGIALAAGAAGAYSHIRRQAGEAITGVAVAVALVPPLAVTGILLEMGEHELAFGAFWLFVANVAGIVLAAALTFVALGLVPGHQLLSGNGRIASGLRWAAIAVMVVVVPLEVSGPLEVGGGLDGPVDAIPEIAAATTAVVQQLDPGALPVDVTVDEAATPIRVEVIVASPNSPIDAAVVATRLAASIDESVVVSIQTLATSAESASVTGPD